MYPAHIDLDRDRDIAIRLDKIIGWLAQRRIEPGTFQFQIAADQVRLRLDFVTRKDATAFAQAFGGHRPRIKTGTCFAFSPLSSVQ